MFILMHHILREGCDTYEPSLPKWCRPDVFARVGKATFLDEQFRRDILHRKKEVKELRKQKDQIIATEKMKRQEFRDLICTYMCK